MPLQRLKLIQSLAEIVTVNGQPFSDLSASGFIKVNAEKLQALTDAGYGIGLKPPKYPAVREHIGYLATQVIEQIKMEVKGKFVSLMVDTASKYQRSILGINVQFMTGPNVVIRSIGMMHLNKSHTAKHISEKIFEQLKMFDIQKNQLISVTTDTARNMTAMIDRFNAMPVDDAEDESVSESEQNADCELSEINFQSRLGLGNEDEVCEVISHVVNGIELEDPDCNEELLVMLSDEPDVERILRELEHILEEFTLKIKGIRCAIHTLQLGVKGALNHDDYKNLISLCRAVCKELRKGSHINELKEKNIQLKIPRIDCKTRWNSTYNMVRFISCIFRDDTLIYTLGTNFYHFFLQMFDLIQHCKSAIMYFANKKKSTNCFQLMLIKWSTMNEILSVLKAPFDVTNASQNAGFTLSDFYGSWCIMKLKLEKLVRGQNMVCNFAEILLTKLEERSSILFNNPAMIVAVYLDPRFNFKMKMNHPDEVQIAKKMLETLHERVTRMHELEKPLVEISDSEEDIFEDDCVASGLQRAFHGEIPHRNDSAAVNKDEFMKLLESYDQIERIHNKHSIVEFWNGRKDVDPVLYESASIIHAIPPSQATVERAFSILNYILNPRRTRLSQSMLENILMINLNKDLVDAIHCRDQQAIAL